MPHPGRAGLICFNPTLAEGLKVSAAFERNRTNALCARNRHTLPRLRSIKGKVGSNEANDGKVGGREEGEQQAPSLASLRGRANTINALICTLADWWYEEVLWNTVRSQIGAENSHNIRRLDKWKVHWGT